MNDFLSGTDESPKWVKGVWKKFKWVTLCKPSVVKTLRVVKLTGGSPLSRSCKGSRKRNSPLSGSDSSSSKMRESSRDPSDKIGEDLGGVTGHFPTWKTSRTGLHQTTRTPRMCKRMFWDPSFVLSVLVPSNKGRKNPVTGSTNRLDRFSFQMFSFSTYETRRCTRSPWVPSRPTNPFYSPSAYSGVCRGRTLCFYSRSAMLLRLSGRTSHNL